LSSLRRRALPGCFTTGREVMDFIKQPGAAADIVLLDINLPDTSGIQLCRDIKQVSLICETCSFAALLPGF
jgi:DNA-binding response OmpR family regulator